MARRTVWSETAQADLQEIFDYVAADSVQYANNTVTRIVESVDRLLDFPLSGKRLRENPAYREIIAGNYRVIHEVSNAEIFIVTVLHGSRMLEL